MTQYIDALSDTPAEEFRLRIKKATDGMRFPAIVELFERFDEQRGDRKTGSLDSVLGFGANIDFYMTRSKGERKPVFRVAWLERNVNYPTDEDFLLAAKRYWEQRKSGTVPNDGSLYVVKSQNFEYSPIGLRRALVTTIGFQQRRVDGTEAYDRGLRWFSTCKSLCE